MFKAIPKRETIYDPITGALPASALGIESKYQRSVRRQIARCVALKTPSVDFIDTAVRIERRRDAGFGHRATQSRRANRYRTVAAALREAGL